MPPEREAGARCPACSRYAGAGASFCPHCGFTLAGTARASKPPRVEVVIGHGDRSFLNRFLRLLLAVWLVAYPVLSCGPILMGAGIGGAAGGTAAGSGLVVGGVLFLPWLVGIIVLGLLALLTR